MRTHSHIQYFLAKKLLRYKSGLFRTYSSILQLNEMKWVHWKHWQQLLSSPTTVISNPWIKSMLGIANAIFCIKVHKPNGKIHSRREWKLWMKRQMHFHSFSGHMRHIDRNVWSFACIAQSINNVCFALSSMTLSIFNVYPKP